MTADEVIQQYVKQYGRNAKAVLEYLAREAPFVEAMETKIGQYVLGMVIEDTNMHLQNFISALTVEEGSQKLNESLVTMKHDYKAGMRLLNRIRDRINEFNKKKL